MPVYDERSEILILGSFPSVRSREVAFYYGNPQNRFWGMLGRVLGGDAGRTTEEKKAFLAAHRIALWDVAMECEIKGSMDSDIRSVVPADVPALLAAAPIRKILCNGKKSRELLKKFFPEIPAECLPSTSPANVSYDESKWRAALLNLPKTFTNEGNCDRINP